VHCIRLEYHIWWSKDTLLEGGVFSFLNLAVKYLTSGQLIPLTYEKQLAVLPYDRRARPCIGLFPLLQDCHLMQCTFFNLGSILVCGLHIKGT
jgi:hypothetical protein